MKKLKPYLFILLPLLILILLRIPSLFESYWYGDEAIYAAVADEFSQGKNLYAETWDHKPPLIFWIFLPAALVGWGSGFVMLRAFNLLLGILSLFFVDQILKRQVDDKPRFIALLFLSLFLGSTYLEGNILNAEVIFIAINTLAILMFFLRKNFYLAGFLVFLSLITKVPGFVEVAFVFAAFSIVYFKEKGFSFLLRSVLKMAVGFTIPLALMLFYFFLKGTISDFIYANVTFNRIYSLHQSNFFNIFGMQFPNTFLQLFSFVSIFIFTTILYWKKKLSAFSYLVINLFTAEVFASLLSAKNYAHYFLQILPGAALLLAIFLQNMKNALNFKSIGLSLVIVVFLIPSFLVFRSGGEIAIHAPPRKYYSLFLRGYVFGDKSAKDQFWWGKQDHIVKAAEFLDNNYLKYNPTYIYTSKPWVIALTNRNLTNKYVAWFHLEYRDLHLNEDLENMRRAEVFVLDNDNPLLESVSNLVNNEFEKVDEFGNYDIYLKK